MRRLVGAPVDALGGQLSGWQGRCAIGAALAVLGLFQRYAFLLLAEVFVRRKMLIGIAIALSAVAVVQGALWVVQVPGD